MEITNEDFSNMKVNKSMVDGKNSLVWAKLKYSPYWPARIVSKPPKNIGKTPPGTVCVFFFGSKNYGFVPAENIVEYVANREKYEKKGRSRGRPFKEAVTQMDEYVQDPIKFSSNGHVELNSNEVVVKTERSAIVKTEREIDEQPYEIEVVQTANSTAKLDELEKQKQNIINDLIVVKEENQKMALQMLKLQSEYDGYKRLTTERINSLSSQLNSLKTELEAEKLKNTSNSQKLSDLSREKRLMSAQLHDIRTPTLRSIEYDGTKDETKDETKDDYEVDCIQNHRNRGRGRQFLISWKGYSSDHDDWVKETNLNCPSILKSYLNGLKNRSIDSK